MEIPFAKKAKTKKEPLHKTKQTHIQNKTQQVHPKNEKKTKP